jgi:hypothetical protein
MCDYSLHQVASRPAKIGDKLITTQFSSSFTHGFSTGDEPNVAVCLLPGTEVAFEREVEIESPWLFLPWRNKRQKVAGLVARFRSVNADQPYAHHDALEFPNGSIVLVTYLRTGQHVTVLQLPASAHGTVRDTEGQKQTVTAG